MKELGAHLGSGAEDEDQHREWCTTSHSALPRALTQVAFIQVLKTPPWTLEQFDGQVRAVPNDQLYIYHLEYKRGRVACVTPDCFIDFSVSVSWPQRLYFAAERKHQLPGTHAHADLSSSRACLPCYDKRQDGISIGDQQILSLSSCKRVAKKEGPREKLRSF